MIFVRGVVIGGTLAAARSPPFEGLSKEFRTPFELHGKLCDMLVATWPAGAAHCGAFATCSKRVQGLCNQHARRACEAVEHARRACEIEWVA